MDNFLQQALNGLQLGLIYALIAIGYTMVYGIVRLINFAHGDVFMVGSLLGFYAIERYGLSLPAVFGAAIAGCVVLAIAIERVAFRPLRNAPRIASLITAIGVSLFLEYFTALHQVFGPDFHAFPLPFRIVSVETFGVRFTNVLAITLLVCVPSLLGLRYIVYRTRLGRGMRAVSYDRVTAGLLGVDANAVISFTFGIGAAFAGLGGVLYGIAYPKIHTFMGILPGLKATTAAVLGGIGSVPGAVLGALIMGQLETMTASFLSARYCDGIALLILIGVLMLKPTGILGSPRTDKV